MTRGYFGIGVMHTKTETNIGTLMRSAFQMGAAFVFTIGRRYKPMSSDTVHAWKHLPVYHYVTWTDFIEHIPRDCPIVAVEMGGREIGNFCHPERCIYLLGAEDYGLSPEVMRRCYCTISLPAVRTPCFNVAVAGSLVMFDRLAKGR
jgi:tRNA G18 (ribose-2'-O)-methylase SpoU